MFSLSEQQKNFYSQTNKESKLIVKLPRKESSTYMIA